MSIGDIYPREWSKIKDLMPKRRAPPGVKPKHMNETRRLKQSQNDGTIGCVCIGFDHVPR